VRAAALGLPALALTDVENLHGQPRFHRAARALGLRPILGVELRAGYAPGTLGLREGRLVLLARDRAGYAALCRVLTRRRTRSIATPTPSPLEDLPPDPVPGLYYLADDSVVIASLLERGVPAGSVRFMAGTPEARGPSTVRRVAAPEVALLDPGDREVHALLIAIRTRSPMAAHTDAVPFPTAAEARAWGARDPEAVLEAAHVADGCTFSFDEVALDFVAPRRRPGESGVDALAREVRDRLERGRAAGRWPGERYERRLAEELDLLRRADFTDLPLAALDIVEEAERRGIAHAGRGSASASLVAHVLGLSQVDPVDLGLYVERFARPGRLDPPDLDLDVSSHRREELAAWTRRHFGADRMAFVCALQTFRARSAVREGLGALGLTPAIVDRWAERVPEEEIGAAAIPEDIVVPGLDRAPALLRSLVGKPHHVSIHPGGILLAGGPIEDRVPLVRAPKGVLAAQYDLHALEALGWPKIDLLGNRALSAIEEAEAILGRAAPPTDGDPETLRLLSRGDTIGCAQIETPPVRAVLRRLPLHGVHDLADALALVRPGPGSYLARERFLGRARGDEPDVALHPRLTDLLAGTHGLLLYEEDEITSIAALTGWTIAESDDARARLARAVSDPAAAAAWSATFVEAAARTGVEREDASRIAGELLRFATYAFHRGHAASYAAIAWRSAWHKAHHPAAFACGVLDHYGGAFPLRAVAADFVRGGLVLRAPHIARSALHATVEEGAVRLGLASIHRLSARTREAILAARPFQDLADLRARVRPSRPELTALLRSGALEGLAPPEEEGRALGAPEDVSRYRALVKLRDELETLGMHPSAHPMAVLRSEAERAGCTPIAAVPPHAGVARVAAIVDASRRISTPAGTVQFVTLEDETGLVEAVLPPRHFAILRNPIRSPGPYLLEVSRGDEDDGPRLIILAARPFHERDRPYA
jgi:DNA polymerase III alpha subunit